MNHFLKKNFSTVGGAGGGGDKADPPPAPRLNPPKLGGLSVLTSYSYSESVDALSEGPIGGIVNQNGQYVDGHRIFEGIYIDDVPVKKTIDPLDNTIPRATVSLSEVMALVTDSWIANGEFQDYSLSNLSTEDISYDPGLSVSNPYQAHTVGNDSISAEIIYGKKNIAKAILKGRNLLNKFSNDSTQESNIKDISKQKLLRYDAFSTESIIENNILKDNPSSTEYPFFCVKINLGNPYDSSEPSQSITDIPVGKSTVFFLEDDVSEIIFQKLEISEIGRRRLIRPLGWIDMSFITQVGPNSVGGYVYLFGIHENGFPTRESVLALRNTAANFHVLDLIKI